MQKVSGYLTKNPSFLYRIGRISNIVSLVTTFSRKVGFTSVMEDIPVYSSQEIKSIIARTYIIADTNLVHLLRHTCTISETWTTRSFTYE